MCILHTGFTHSREQGSSSYSLPSTAGLEDTAPCGSDVSRRPQCAHDTSTPSEDGRVNLVLHTDLPEICTSNVYTHQGLVLFSRWVLLSLRVPDGLVSGSHLSTSNVPSPGWTSQSCSGFPAHPHQPLRHPGDTLITVHLPPARLPSCRADVSTGSLWHRQAAHCIPRPGPEPSREGAKNAFTTQNT